MKAKQKALDTLHHDSEWVNRKHPEGEGAELDYGDLAKLGRFEGTHPVVMAERIAAKDWTVPVEGKGIKRGKHKHETLKVRLHTFLENKILKRKIGEGKNYILIK
jgi:hypothetical protein